MCEGHHHQMGQFSLFYTICGLKNEIYPKMKKTPGDIIVLH